MIDGLEKEPSTGRIPAPEPGVLHNVPGEDYARWDTVSFRRLMRLARSPHTMQHFLAHPEDEPEPAPNAELGIALHCAALEPERYAASYEVLPEGRSNSKIVEAAREKAESAGKLTISHQHAAMVRRMMDSIHAHPQISKVFQEPARLTELSIVAPHEGTGLLMKVRLDLLLQPQRMVLDLKSIGKQLEIDELEKSIFGWAQQLAMMEQALRASGADLVAEHYGVLAVEQKPANECGAFFPDSGTMELAHHRIDTLMALYAKCAAADHWPRIGEEGVIGLSARSWDFKRYGQEYTG